MEAEEGWHVVRRGRRAGRRAGLSSERPVANQNRRAGSACSPEEDSRAGWWGNLQSGPLFAVCGNLLGGLVLQQAAPGDADGSIAAGLLASQASSLRVLCTRLLCPLRCLAVLGIWLGGGICEGEGGGAALGGGPAAVGATHMRPGCHQPVKLSKFSGNIG